MKELNSSISSLRCVEMSVFWFKLLKCLSDFDDCGDSSHKASQKAVLYDHLPLCLNSDDYQRVCQIPKRKVLISFFFFLLHNLLSIYFIFLNAIFNRKAFLCPFQGANFRDLPGVLFGPDKKVQWDPDVERVYLPSGKPLVMTILQFGTTLLTCWYENFINCLGKAWTC